MRRILSIWLCIVIISSSASILLNFDQDVTAKTPIKTAQYTSRGSIFIESDADFTAGNGVTAGTGVIGNPYIIDGWSINNTGPDDAISISYTDAHLIIKDCKITNLSYYNWIVYGLLLWESNNVTIQNCTFSDIDSDWGFRTAYSNNITVINNSFINSAEIRFDSCSDVDVYNNLINNTEPHKFVQAYCDRVNYWNNSFINSGIEIKAWTPNSFDNTEITLNNTVNSKPLRYYKNNATVVIDDSTIAGQVIIFQSPDVLIDDFNVSNTAVGIEIAFSGSIVCRDSVFSNNVDGFFFYDNGELLIENIASHNNTGRGGTLTYYDWEPQRIYNSAFIDNGDEGLSAQARGAQIENNSFINNGVGLGIWNPSSDAYVNNCKMINNSELGVDIWVHPVTLINCEISENYNGIGIANVGTTNLYNLILDNNTNHGISGGLEWATGLLNVDNCTVSNSAVGVQFSNTYDSNITSCTLTNNQIGIRLDDRTNNTMVHNNSIINCLMGINSVDVKNNEISKNTITDISGLSYTESVDSSTANVYQNDANWDNYSSFEDQLTNGQLGTEPLYTKPVLVNGISKFYVHIVGDADAPDLDLGLFLDGKDGNPKDGITQTGEFLTYGADADADEEVSIDFPEDGTYLIRVFGFTVTGDPGHFDIEVVLSSINSSAILLLNSSATIFDNIIQDNNVGIQMDQHSTNSTIYHNNFIGNTNHAIDFGNNTWDNGVLSGGNHWNNWTSPDDNSDGYVDSPLVIGNGNMDCWPFAELWSEDYSTPIADAGLNRTVIQGDIVDFNASGSSDNVGIINYTWDFNYNGTSIQLFEVSPSFEFIYIGNYTVELNVLDAGGNSDSDQIWVNVEDNPDDPFADAGPDIIIGLNEIVIFNASASQSLLPIDSYAWTFEYNSTQVVLNDNLAEFTFGIIGNYSVNLTISADGDTDTDQMWIHVVETTMPIAVAGEPIIINQGTDVTFNASASSSIAGIVNYTWNISFGELHLAYMYGVSPSHMFTEMGLYYVMLNVSDAAGNFDTDGLTVHVLDTEAPVADAGPDQEVEVGATVTFSGAGSTDNIGIVNYTWTFTYNGSVVTLYGVEPEFTFWAAGNYTITLNVTDLDGNWDTDQLVISVTEDSAQGNYWWVLVIVLALVGVGITVYLMQRKHSEDGGSEQVEENGADEVSD